MMAHQEMNTRAGTAAAGGARRGVLGLAALLGLAACAGERGGVVYHTNFTAGYVPASVAAAQPLLVETYGSPTPGLTREQVTEATIAGLRRSGPAWMPRNYTGNPQDAGQTAYRLRVAYGAPQAFNRQRLCNAGMDAAAMEPARTQDDADSTRTVASLCRWERAVAVAEGSPGTEPDVRSERFADFVGLLGRQVMPRQNPVTRDECAFVVCD